MGLERQARTRGRLWMKLKRQVLCVDPVCVACRRRPSVEADHIIPICKGGTDEFDNLQGMCKECHEEKTRKDLGLKAKAHKVGIDGYPIIRGK
ncbi:HNH endonuclease [Candidatus Pacearchaeota archaeon]|nr:HNH endonuclease [Candidatus Pacearchaeota archaeon]